MFKLTVFVALLAFAAARPQGQYRAPQQGYGAPQQQGGYQGQNGYQGQLQGAAQTVQESEAGMPYQFNWQVQAPEFGNDYSHQQSSDGRVTQGEYRVLLPDSRVQIVRFTADENGYVADVQYEGTAQFPQASNQVNTQVAYGGNNGGYQGQQQQGYSNGGGAPQRNYGAPGRR